MAQNYSLTGVSKRIENMTKNFSLQGKESYCEILSVASSK